VGGGPPALQPVRRPALHFADYLIAWSRNYNIFDSGVYRILAVKWLFPQEKATFDALVMSTSEAKML